MEYSITQLSKLSGVSGRTLRYYDEIGLLSPARTNDAGYRFYGEREVELLQQILFYRERGLPLEQIREVVYNENFDVMTALYDHLSQLESQRIRLEGLIATVKKTISATKGEVEMDNEERFDQFKEHLVTENEKIFGKEVREKYGDAEMDASNRKLLSMTEADYERFQNLNQEILVRLAELVQRGTHPHSE